MHIDHVVLWVSDVDRSLAFYARILGLETLRVDAFRAGTAPFPSARVSEHTILDLMPKTLSDFVRAATGDGARSAAGDPMNHVCLSMPLVELEALRTRLTEAGVATVTTATPSFGARGITETWFYFQDPDGNVLEARAYPAEGATSESA